MGLSDIDIAIVSEEFENREKIEVLNILLQKFFDTFFEFHLLSEKQRNY